MKGKLGKNQETYKERWDKANLKVHHCSYTRTDEYVGKVKMGRYTCTIPGCPKNHLGP